ncbi:MAG TPA: EpsI family protein [Sphingomicrobium sp.]|nr:EpsI family protein [Sphingomicrobium sp.]
MAVRGTAEPRQEPVASRRELLVGAGLGSAALLSGLLWQRAEAARAARPPALDSIVPAVIGRWAHVPGADSLIPTGEAPNDPYDEVLTRNYADGSGAAIMMLIAFGSAQTGNAQLHRPEVCYPAVGFELGKTEEVRLSAAGAPPIQARVLTARAPGRLEQILYWSRIGKEFPTTASGQRWAAFRQTLGGPAPDGVLFRISMISGDRPHALRQLNSFAGALLATPGAELRRLLVGSP